MLTIGGCPCDLDIGYFKDCFLSQFQLLYPKSGFRKIENIKIYKQNIAIFAIKKNRQMAADVQEDVMEEKLIAIKFPNSDLKKKALTKMKDCLYKQEEHHQYIYALHPVHELEVNDEVNENGSIKSKNVHTTQNPYSASKVTSEFNEHY